MGEYGGDDEDLRRGDPGNESSSSGSDRAELGLDDDAGESKA